MKCDLLTIFTPTYNRAYILSSLYLSLTRQNDKHFEWIIVDDGSTDNTSALVREWMALGNIDIVYKYQPNQGKHIAINTGLELAHGELFFIVDSDDNLTLDAVEQVRKFWNAAKDIKNISGILSYRQFPNGKLVGTKLPKNVSFCKLRDCERKYGSVGDKVVIYRTDVISRFRYPQFRGERFLGESFVFNQIDDQYDMLVMDARIYNFDYQKDGLSQDFRKLYRENPKGMRLSMMQAMNYQDGIKYRLKTLAHVGCLSIYLHDMSSYFSFAQFPLVIIALPLALVLYFRIFIQKKSDVKPFLGSENQ